MIDLRKGLTGKYVFFITMSLATSLGNMGVVYLTNQIIKSYFSGEHLRVNEYILYFLGAISLFFAGRWIVSLGIIRFTQEQLRRMRKNVLQMVLKSSYISLEKNKGRIFTALTRDAENVVNASVNIVEIVTNGIVILICFIYMGTMSWKLFLCMLAVVIFTLLIYFMSVNKARKLFRKALTFNDNFVKYLNEVLTGFKEVTIERRKGKEIADRHIRVAIDSSSLLYQKAQVYFLNNRIVGQIAFYVFIATLLLALGDLFNVPKVTLVNFIFLVLYVWSPIETVVLLVPSLTQANISLKRLTSLEYQMMDAGSEDMQVEDLGKFEQLTLRNVTYTYKPDREDSDERPFGIGPVDFDIRAGEVVFISGGNGSGKTTFIHTLVGLLNKDGGEIFVNDLLMESDQLHSYRSLFAPVFSNFHLFDECYGITDIDCQKAEEYLRFLEIDTKVTMKETKFSTIDLSTGQRKRLALCNAMLERKPILILDEFAAEQDPYFKRKFYKEVLPYLKSEGFTVIAITHDDNYYSHGDRIYKMDAGKLYEMEFENNCQPVSVSHE